MTYDKMKHYISPQVFDFWTNCTDEQKGKIAYVQLCKEMESGILTGIQYEAEKQLLQYLFSIKS